MDNDTTINPFLKDFDTITSSIGRCRRSNASERLRKLKNLEDYLMEPAMLDKICDALHQDLGKSRTEALASEVMVAIHSIRYIRKHLQQWMRPRHIGKPLLFMGTSNYVYHESRGAALIISPWNYPFQLAINPISYAVAAGCPFILKPSEYSTATSALLQHIVTEVFSDDEGQVHLGDADTSQALLQLPFNHIYFTGSTTVGKIVMKAASEHLSSITLELGGKSPCIVAEDADVQETCKKIIWGKLYNNGQTCIAPDHLYVPSSKKEQYVKGLQHAVKEMYGSDLLSNADYGRIISDRHYTRAINLLQDCETKGATIINSGPLSQDNRHIPPTFITNPSDDMLVMQEEIFAPILPIIGYDNIDDVLAGLARKPKPLAMYIMSGKRKWTNHVIRHSTAGTTVVNDFLIQYANHHLPFGGVNASGIGKSHGRDGFMAFTNERSIVKQSWSLTKIVHPPYTSKKEKLVGLMMRWMG